ncbi:PQQ-dependent sugar dehydrogenase [Paracoccus tibetensis]|uniref:Glucose/arabinose dehydrogenase, beta-propeller fold n=1 Tax=Paracoccus tibetensis TaxID=336292 RepID=A0A1G5H817_9RHOB|nr:PQQ-dependent sugar dehydrogenase [Paracoccus tibetensis]SCY59098.1 Glucose/arabinose dehydrogenase, beta-propeller fold [Paracoccus tibetensis]
MTTLLRAALTSPVALASPFALALALPAAAEYGPVESQFYTLEVETVAEGLEHPWGMAFLDEDRFLVTERNPGTVRLGTREGGMGEVVWQAEDLFRPEGETERSQAGLFDIVLHPDFDENGWVYLSYSRETDRGAALVVVRGTVTGEGEDARIEEVEDIFVMKEEDQDSSGLHFGGRMAFDPSDNALFLTVGERRNISRAQDASDQAGSVLRMTDAGEPHGDNPTFAVDEDDQNDSPDDYLFSIGNRNVQALGMHPVTNELWASDHGPLGGDEINLIAAGNNYGWPFTTGGDDYSGAPMGVGETMEGMTPPVHIFGETVAPSGLTFVPDGAEKAEWAGDMLIGGLVTEGLMRVRLEGGAVAEEEAIEIGRRIRDVQVGPDGMVWLLTEHEDGEVLRLVPQVN